MQQHHDDHHHHHHSITLPLRLAAEPYAKEAISSSCVSLGIIAGSNASIIELAALCDVVRQSLA